MIMTDTPKLWRDMTPEEKGALLLAHHEGETIQTKEPKLGSGWFMCEPKWRDEYAYRIKPEPVRETVTLMYRPDEDIYTVSWPDTSSCDYILPDISLELIDGAPATIKMEPLK